MREGAKIRPQCVGYFYHVVNGETRSCAIGAAFEHAGFYNPELLEMPCHLDDKAYLFDGISKHWGDRSLKLDCPSGCGDRFGAPGMATHLNDVHWWTRERIADWLEEKG